jgi:hypothetical protein
MCLLTWAKNLEKGRPLSVAKDQVNLGTEAKILNREINKIQAIIKTRKLVTGLLFVAW